jgi:hypothetical protein
MRRRRHPAPHPSIYLTDSNFKKRARPNQAFSGSLWIRPRSRMLSEIQGRAHRGFDIGRRAAEKSDGRTKSTSAKADRPSLSPVELAYSPSTSQLRQEPRHVNHHEWM